MAMVVFVYPHVAPRAKQFQRGTDICSPFFTWHSIGVNIQLCISF